jgi:hypothetical protein
MGFAIIVGVVDGCEAYGTTIGLEEAWFLVFGSCFGIGLLEGD